MSRQRLFSVKLKSVVTELFSIVTGSIVWCRDKAGLAGRCRDQALDKAHSASDTHGVCVLGARQDSAVLLHCAMQLFELQCSCIVHELFIGIVQKKKKRVQK